MKYILMLVLLSMASLQVKAVEMTKLTCYDYEKEARAIMEYRQSDGASLAKALGRLENMVSEYLEQGADPKGIDIMRERLRWLIVDSFEEMQFFSKSGKQRKINEYANEQMLACLEARKE